MSAGATVLHLVERLGLGGLERVVLTLARRASPRYRVGVVALCGGGRVAEECAAHGIPVTVLAARSYSPLWMLRVAAQLRALAPDVVHTHGFFAGVLGRGAARIAGVGVLVHHLHTLDSSLRPRHRAAERILGRLTRRVLCCSAAVERHATGTLGLPAGLARTIPNGIEPPPVIDAAQARRRLGSPPAPVIGCVGGLHPHKGQAVLIRAWAALCAGGIAGTLVIVGDGPDRASLERLAAAGAARGRVWFSGERPDARELLPGLDLAVVPSIAREGQSLACLEAMDAGLPVVASRLGGLVEVVDDPRSGVLVAPGDEDALAAAMTGVLSRPDRGRRLGAAGRRRVEERYRAAEMVRRVEDVYEEGLDARRAA